jgi:hypothetical protein
MSTRDIGEQHNDEDYGGWMPTATDFINEIPLTDWMFGGKTHSVNLSKDSTMADVLQYQYWVWANCVYKRPLIMKDESDRVWNLLNYGMRHASDIRGNALTHNAWFINTVVTRIHNPCIVNVCIDFIETLYSKIPTAQEWVMEMPLTGWMNNGRGKAPSQAILFRQKRDNSMNRKAIDND